MREPPTGTVTLLFTDIEGSTKLLHELGDRYGEVLAEHRRVLREAFAAHGGVEVDTQGDAFFVAFARATNAVAAAEQAQRALNDPSNSLLQGRLGVRVGIHTGEPTLGGEGYVGIDVHRAARVMAAGHGGQVVLSQTTRELLDEQFELRDLGEHRLKDLAEPEWLFQLGKDEFPPLKSLNNTNLPAPANPLVGRERELEELAELLQRDEVRLLTLTGAGGTGKTRLALEVAAELGGDYPNGVFFVSLAPISDPALVVPTIAQTLGVKEQAAESIVHTLGRELESKKTLVFLDNFEQVVEAAPQLGELLERAPKLNLLVTSREPLHLGAEHEYAVPPLPEPDAISLFHERAANAEPLEAVAEICRRLDGLPLAIELAAARTKVLLPKKLLERLDQRLPLLTGKRRDLPERQQTLTATIAWSYDLLSSEEQGLFARLAVFVGGCTLEASEQVCAANLVTLESLVDKSLVRQREGAEGEPRFWMLETIREFALARLGELPERPEIHQRHASFITSFAEEGGDFVRDFEPAATARFDAELENIREASSWLLEVADKETGERLLGAMWFYWWVRGHVREAYAFAQRVLLMAGETPAYTHANAFAKAGELARFTGDLREAVQLKRAASEIFRGLGERHKLAGVLTDLAHIAAVEGDFDRGRLLAEEAVALRRALGVDWGVAHALGALAHLESRQGHLDAAERILEEILEVWRSANSPDEIAESLFCLGDVRRRLRQFESARELLEEGLKLAVRVGDEDKTLDCLEAFACLAADERSMAQAARLWGAASALRIRIGMGTSEWIDPAEQERLRAFVRAEIGEPKFAALEAEGERLDAVVVVNLALHSID